MSHYSSEKGILFSKDKTQLLICPPLAVSGAFSVPQGVTQIGYCAFWQCDGITSVRLPEGLTTINAQAFHYCENVTRINIPDSVTIIGYNAFVGCKSLQTVEIPAGVENIGQDAFLFCDSVPAYIVSEENTQYCSENGVLFNKDKTILIKYPSAKTDTSYQIPEGVQHLKMYAFYYCLSLSSLSIPRSLTDLGVTQTQFIRLDKLKEFIADSDNPAFTTKDGVLFTKDMKELIFCPFGKPGTYSIPFGATVIRNNAFQYNTFITQVIIPDGVETIGEEAFYDNTALSSITIPDSVTAVGKYAFCLCKNLKNIYYGGTKKEWAAVKIEDGNDPLQEAVLHPIRATFILPKNLTRIESEAFANLKNAVIRIPSKVNYIAGDAFSKQAVLLCTEGSYAEKRSRELGFRVKAE